MTLCILGKDPESNDFGGAICSSSFAVGGRCLWIHPSKGIATTQNLTNPLLGIRAIDLFSSTLSLKEILHTIKQEDSHIEHRQLGLFSFDEGGVAYTGSNAFAHSGHILGKDHLVLGNLLANSSVLYAMSSSFTKPSGSAFHIRLLHALEAGIHAGGETRAIRSAAVLGSNRKDNWPYINIRVDDDNAPVAKLLHLASDFEQHIHNYRARVGHPMTGVA